MDKRTRVFSDTKRVRRSTRSIASKNETTVLQRKISGPTRVVICAAIGFAVIVAVAYVVIARHFAEPSFYEVKLGSVQVRVPTPEGSGRENEVYIPDPSIDVKLAFVKTKADQTLMYTFGNLHDYDDVDFRSRNISSLRGSFAVSFNTMTGEDRYALERMASQLARAKVQNVTAEIVPNDDFFIVKTDADAKRDAEDVLLRTAQLHGHIKNRAYSLLVISISPNEPHPSPSQEAQRWHAELQKINSDRIYMEMPRASRTGRPCRNNAVSSALA